MRAAYDDGSMFGYIVSSFDLDILQEPAGGPVGELAQYGMGRTKGHGVYLAVFANLTSEWSKADPCNLALCFLDYRNATRSNQNLHQRNDFRSHLSSEHVLMLIMSSSLLSSHLR